MFWTDSLLQTRVANPQDTKGEDHSANVAHHQGLVVELLSADLVFPSAVLDRLLHPAETVVIEGGSYRMKDQIEP